MGYCMGVIAKYATGTAEVFTEENNHVLWRFKGGEMREYAGVITYPDDPGEDAPEPRN